MKGFVDEGAIEEECRLLQKAIDQIAAGEYRTLNSKEDIELFVREIAQRSEERRRSRHIDRKRNA